MKEQVVMKKYSVMGDESEGVSAGGGDEPDPKTQSSIFCTRSQCGINTLKFIVLTLILVFGIFFGIHCFVDGKSFFALVVLKPFHL